MDFITFRCAFCDHGMKVGAEKAGRKAKCPKCKKELTIPKPEGAPPASPAPAANPADEFKVGEAYGLLVDPAEEEKQKQRLREEEEQKRKMEKKEKKPPPRIEIKQKELKNKKQWLLVRKAIPFYLIAIGVWGAAFLFPLLVVVIGLFSGTDFNAADKNLLQEMPDNPAPGHVQGVDRVSFGIALIASADAAGVGNAFFILGFILALAQGGLMLTGYFISLAVPDRFGTRSQVKALIVLGCINLFVILVFKLLPTLGVIGYGLMALISPAAAMGDINIDRQTPLLVFWCFSPFWDMTFVVILLILLYLEPILMGLFLWSVGISIRELDLEEAGLGLAKIGFGVLFTMLAYLIVGAAGTSEVLITVLRVVFILWVGFTAGWIYRFVRTLLQLRDVLDKRIFGVEYEDEGDDQDQEDEGDEEDE